MSNPIYSGTFSSHQQLPAAQLDAVLLALNNHDHGTETGGGLPAQFIPQILTTTQKNALVTPSTGLCVWDSTLAVFSYWNGSAWTSLGSTAVVITNLTSDPGSPVNGQMWLRTDF